MRKRLTICLISIMIFTLAAGCGKFTLKHPARLSLAWPQLGRSPHRNAVCSTPPRFPLSLIWEKRASSALGITMLAGMNYVLFGTQDGKMEGLYLKDGDKIGKINIRSKVELTAAIAGEHMIVVKRLGEKNIIGYDLTKGKTAWELSAGHVPGEPLIVEKRVYLATAGGQLLCLDMTDGKKQYEYQLPSACSTTPAFLDDRLIIGDDRGTIHALTAHLEPVWQYPTNAAIRSPAVLAHGTVFQGSTDGTFYALTMADGALRWKTDIGAKIYHPAAISDSLVIFGATNHMVYAVSRERGSIQWRYDCGSVIATAPLLCGDHVFIGAMNKKLYAIDAAQGDVTWEYTAKGRIRSYPIAVDPYLIFSSEDDYVYCFRLH